MAIAAPCGSWPSPVLLEHLSAGVKIGWLSLTIDDGLIWSEVRPANQGKTMLVKFSNHKTSDMLPSEWSACSHVHEYGGLSFVVNKNIIYFVSQDDQQVYSVVDSVISKITNSPKSRFINLQCFGSNLVAVEEDHSADKEPANNVVFIDTSNGEVYRLHTGADFYSSITCDYDSKKIAFVRWYHPNMPWDSTELVMGVVDEQNHKLDDFQIIDGGRGDKGQEISICLPVFYKGDIYYSADPNGWWNIFKFNTTTNQVTQLLSEVFEGEFGEPHWIFGNTRFAFCPITNTLWTVLTMKARDYLARIALDDQECKCVVLESELTSIRSLIIDSKGQLFALGSSMKEPEAVGRITVTNSTANFNVIHRSLEPLDSSFTSMAQLIEHNTGCSIVPKSYSFYYPPASGTHCVPNGELPPIIVTCHGGPTACSKPIYSSQTLFWTSRGFGVLSVNYRGSTGFGKPYRDALRQKWGEVDVIDVKLSAERVMEMGLCDPKRVAIRGRSAGGYLALAGPAFCGDTFKVGVSYFGVADLSALNDECHKFESQYCNSMIGPLPERADVYHERSPLFHTDLIKCPILLLQQLRDTIP